MLMASEQSSFPIGCLPQSTPPDNNYVEVVLYHPLQIWFSRLTFANLGGGGREGRAFDFCYFWGGREGRAFILLWYNLVLYRPWESGG